MEKHTFKQILAFSLVFIYICVMLVSGLDSITGFVSSSQCGNNVCEVEENYATCPKDCAATCGDNLCEEEETYTCVMDCKEARTATIEERAFFSSAVMTVFAVSTALMLGAIALIATPRKAERARKRKRKSSRR